MDRPLYSLHLFAGAGGGILADAYAGVEPVCAVEIEEYPRRVLSLRWPGMAIWDDVRTFRADNPECASAFAWLRPIPASSPYAGGFHARTFPLPESSRESTASVPVCGGSLPEYFARFDRASCSWKTPPTLFGSDWDEFCSTWPRSGLMLGGTCWRLPPWEPGTSASESGSPGQCPPTTLPDRDDQRK